MNDGELAAANVCSNDSNERNQIQTQRKLIRPRGANQTAYLQQHSAT